MDNKDLTEFGRREAMTLTKSANSTKITRTRYKYSQDRAHIIITYLLKGTTIKGACKAANIHRDTYYLWKKEIPEFREMIEAAEGDIEASLVESILSDDDWRAKAWILERRFRESWSQKQEVDITIEKKTSEEVVKTMLTNIAQKENLDN
jgi:ACT domain-containing protein